MSERVTILYVITSTNAGGTEKALWELVRRLDRSRFAPHVCSLKKSGAFAGRLAEAAAGFYSLGLPEAGSIQAAAGFAPAFLKLVRLVREVRPVILHAFLFQANMYGRLAAAVCSTPVVISSLRVTEARALPHLANRLTASLVDCYTAVSEAVRQEAISRSGIAPDKIITIPNGIDCDILAPSAGEPENSDIFTVVLPGRLHRQKGHVVLLKALKLLEGGLPEVRAVLLGEGPEEQALKKTVAELGIAGRVLFQGLADDSAEAIRSADAVVMPSLWEGMPNAVLEAMALGKPAVASRIPGMDELVQDGRTGLLFAPGSAEELAAALSGLARDRGRARAMGAAARELAISTFSLHTTVSETVALYERLLGRRGEARGRQCSIY